MKLQPTGRDKFSIVLFLTDGSRCQSFFSRIFVMLLSACYLAAPVILAADGDVDPTFKIDVTENNGLISAVAVQPDGKVLVGGFFEAFGGRSRRGIARLSADGAVDLTFDAGAAIPNARSAQATVKAIVVQPDNKILVGLSYQSPGATPRKLIVRLYPDGTLDLSFTTNLLTRPFQADSAFAIALQSDGKIIVGGAFRYTNGTQRDLARLNSDGSVDSSFLQPTTGIGANNVRAIAVQPDGRILVGGTAFNGPSLAATRQAFWRLNTDGTVDTGYSDMNIPSSGTINALALQPDGSMIAVGSANFSGQVPNVMRITANGTRDPNFADAIPPGLIVQLARQTDGKIIVVGNFQITTPATRNNIARLNTDGTLDTTFVTSGSVGTVRAIDAVGLQSDGRVIAAGRFDNFNGSPAEDYLRLNTDGSRDSSFISNSVGYYGRVHALLRQPDGKLLIGIGSDFGGQTKVNGVRTNGIVRLNQDYSVDTSFTSPFTNGAAVFKLALQPDGRILVSGLLQINQTAFSFLRLNANGAVDAGFNPPPNLQLPVIQPDGRIIATGGGEVVRLNSDGTRDNSFTATLTGFGVSSIGLQADGKVIVGGSFSSINGTARVNVARLNANGSVDTGFDPGVGANDTVRTLIVAPDGRLFIGGRFTSFNGTPRARLALVEANGSLNATFVPVNPGDIEVYAVVLQADGKLLYGGEQLPAGGRGVYRLNTNGALDASFALGADSNQVPNIYAILPETNGKILIGGRFESYNDAPRMSFARLNPRGQSADFDYDNRADLSVFRPSDRIWYIMNSSNSQFYGYLWGVATDKLAPADYDGDGKTDVAVWREDPAIQAAFYILNSSNLTVRIEQFGQIGDIPLAGDFDGDGRADVSLYRGAAQSIFFYRASFNNPNGNTTYLPWGTVGDIPVAGDYDGDGKTDACVFRPSNATWVTLRSSDLSVQTTAFGQSGDKLVPADYDGDSKTDIAIFRNGVWWILQSASGAVKSTSWGLPTDTLVPADYDGDGRADLAIYRGGTWWIAQSTSNSSSVRFFGLANDTPIASAFVR